MSYSSMYKKIASLIFIFVAVLSVTHFAQALTITPIRLEISGDPGQVLSEEMTLINERDTKETYYVSYANFESQGESGSPAFAEAKSDLGTWMSAPEVVILEPHSSKIVPVKVTVPKDADPGGHFAAIFWGTTPNTTVPGTVAIGAKTGMLVLLRVNGAVNEQGGLLGFSTKDSKTFYTSLPVDFFYRFQNAGGDRIKPVGNIVMRNMIGLKSALVPANPVDGNILPGSVRRFETTWQGGHGGISKSPEENETFWKAVSREWKNFAFGYYRANLELAYGATNQKSEAHIGLWVFPWQLTIVSLIVLLITYFGGRTGIRRYNEWVITQAEKRFEELHSKDVK